jgi:hypothetical protein
MTDIRAGLARRNAAAAARALTEAGWDVTTKDYPPMGDDEIGARHYVMVTTETFQYQAQWHRNATHGTSFMRNRGDGWDETTARLLSLTAEEAAPAGNAASDADA